MIMINLETRAKHNNFARKYIVIFVFFVVMSGVIEQSWIFSFTHTF